MQCAGRGWYYDGEKSLANNVLLLGFVLITVISNKLCVMSCCCRGVTEAWFWGCLASPPF